jgi:hypothetical protein
MVLPSMKDLEWMKAPMEQGVREPFGVGPVVRLGFNLLQGVKP